MNQTRFFPNEIISDIFQFLTPNDRYNLLEKVPELRKFHTSQIHLLFYKGGQADFKDVNYHRLLDASVKVYHFPMGDGFDPGGFKMDEHPELKKRLTWICESIKEKKYNFSLTIELQFDVNDMSMLQSLVFYSQLKCCLRKVPHGLQIIKKNSTDLKVSDKQKLEQYSWFLKFVKSVKLRNDEHSDSFRIECDTPFYGDRAYRLAHFVNKLHVGKFFKHWKEYPLKDSVAMAFERDASSASKVSFLFIKQRTGESHRRKMPQLNRWFTDTLVKNAKDWLRKLLLRRSRDKSAKQRGITQYLIANKEELDFLFGPDIWQGVDVVPKAQKSKVCSPTTAHTQIAALSVVEHSHVSPVLNIRRPNWKYRRRRHCVTLDN